MKVYLLEARIDPETRAIRLYRIRQYGKRHMALTHSAVRSASEPGGEVNPEFKALAQVHAKRATRAQSAITKVLNRRAQKVLAGRLTRIERIGRLRNAARRYKGQYGKIGNQLHDLQKVSPNLWPEDSMKTKLDKLTSYHKHRMLDRKSMILLARGTRADFIASKFQHGKDHRDMFHRRARGEREAERMHRSEFHQALKDYQSSRSKWRRHLKKQSGS